MLTLSDERAREAIQELRQLFGTVIMEAPEYVPSVEDGLAVLKKWAESAPQEAGARDLDKVEKEAAIRKRARTLKREIESAHTAERKAQMAAYDAAPDNSSDHRRFCEGWEAAKEWAERGVPLTKNEKEQS